MEEEIQILSVSRDRPLSDRIPIYVVAIVILLFLISLLFFVFYIYSFIGELKTIKEKSNYLQDYVDHLQSAKTLWSVGDYRRVIQEGEFALNIAKTDEQKAGAHYWIGIGYYRLGNLDESQKHEEMAISLDPSFNSPYVTLGAIMLDRGNINKAKELANKAIELDPDYSWAHNLFGLVLNQEGKKEEAIVEIKKAIVLEPKNEVFRQNLKYIEG